MDTVAESHLTHLRRLRAAKDVMDRDWADETLDLDAVASRAGYSRSHFVRVFKTAYGRTPASTSPSAASNARRRCCAPAT